MKNISILGSTGSIGTQALEIVREKHFKVSALTAHRNIKLLENQARELTPSLVCIYDEKQYKPLKERLKDTNIKVLCGMEGLCAAATVNEADIVLTSVVGMIGLQPTIAAINAGKDIALANKETLVTGGKLVKELARKKGVSIIPVDSEHSAIFQSLQGSHNNLIHKIILTASGGPFFGKKQNELQNINVSQALNHPNWQMGAKITIDSATLMNKGLELIEAVWLFDCNPADVEIVVHRESVLHSAIEFEDYSVIGQMGVPNMKIPIQYALTYPKRLPCAVKPLNLIDYGKLTFAEPDRETFLCLKAAEEAIKRGGLYPTIINGANEQAVALFLDGKISFLEIGEFVSASMCINGDVHEYTIEDIIRYDQLARQYVLDRVNL